ncbi:hypothetical protein EPN18_09760 [bacterium]|nr:MAG: hypothetical protein EPN18_09760 [bacterium]
MSKKRTPIVDPKQMSLLELLTVNEQAQSPGAFDVETRLKEEASLALRMCRLSRYEVAAKMSEMLGREVTKSMLDNRTAESKEDQMWPAAWLAPFAVVTGHNEQIKLINKLARLPIADSEKLLDMEINRKQQLLEEEQKELDDLKHLKAFVQGNGKGSRK